MENYTIPIEKQADEKKLKILKTLINPFVLRRTKTQVAKDLPSKIEQIIHCDMTEEQESEYETIKSQYRNELLQVIKEQGIGKIKAYHYTGTHQIKATGQSP
jgi:SNF2 family DNA or RNA helicase